MAAATRKRIDKPRSGLWPFGRRRADGRLGEVQPGGYGAEPEQSLGDWLRAARHDKGLTLEELAETTRVRRAYLEALEEGRLDALPSRPFTMGYIRAFAQALGLDPDAAVIRFKSEEPVIDEPLRNPVGVLDEKDPRVAAFMMGAIVIVAAILTWNIAQRAMTSTSLAPPKASDDRTWKVLAAAKPQPVVLGLPLAAPVESTIPPPYETPGLAEAMGLKAAPGTGGPATPKPTDDPLAQLASLPKVFTPAGQVYGPAAPAVASPLTVQALRPGLLIARGADGSVYFARQLAKGDAYKVPQVAGLTLDVSSAQDFQVFVSGQSKGLLPAQQVLASKLMTPAAAPAV